MAAVLEGLITEFDGRLNIYPYVEQRTPTWLSWRVGRDPYPTVSGRPRITASLVDVILEQNPWNEPADAYDEILGVAKEKVVSEAMELGTKFEPMALEKLSAKVKHVFIPVCVSNLADDSLAASLDGMTEDCLTLAEVKAVGSLSMTYRQCAKGIVPAHYLERAIWSLGITGAEKLWFGCLAHDTEHLAEPILVLPDPQRYAQQVEAVRLFQERVLTGDAPERAEKVASLPIDDEVAIALFEEFIEQKGKEKAAKVRMKEISESLGSRMPGRKNYCGLGTISFVDKPGGVSHATLTAKVLRPMLRSLGLSKEEIDAKLDAFRNKESSFWMIRVAGETEETAEGEEAGESVKEITKRLAAADPTAKKGRGRPKKVQVEPEAPKRPRGRPKKTDA